MIRVAFSGIGGYISHGYREKWLCLGKGAGGNVSGEKVKLEENKIEYVKNGIQDFRISGV